MDLKISKEKAEFNESEFGSDKLCVVVQFPNCISTKTNKPFKWMPTYKQLRQIVQALQEIEKESWNGD